MKLIEGMNGYRDTNSNALIFTDDLEYERVINRRNEYLENKSNQDTINIMKNEIEQLREIVSQLINKE